MSRNIPASDHHKVTQNLSPQYLFPSNFQPAPHQCPYIIRPAFKNSEKDRDLGDWNLSPQFLFPPNYWSPILPSEPIAEQHWGVTALTAFLTMKYMELKPWSLISLLDRLRYCQRPPFIIFGRTYFKLYKSNLLGTLAE
mmetsp:Transcript_36919/g.72646  ORF Transcript_36919/g.72646 Transcript_36919/m.72646 type:complete len:139 (+) Transcript_36919:151-567(+)